eukprot:1516631-Rhodomonas_salina.2
MVGKVAPSPGARIRPAAHGVRSVFPLAHYTAGLRSLSPRVPPAAQGPPDVLAPAVAMTAAVAWCCATGESLGGCVFGSDEWLMLQ